MSDPTYTTCVAEYIFAEGVECFDRAEKRDLSTQGMEYVLDLALSASKFRDAYRALATTVCQLEHRVEELEGQTGSR